MKKIYYSKRIGNIKAYTNAVRENSGTIFMLSMFAVGLAIGAFTVISGKYNNSYLFNTTLKNTVEQMLTNNSGSVFADTLLSASVFTVSTLPWALCCIGIPVLSFIPILRGIGYGAIGTYLITQYSLSGMAYYSLYIVPGAIISVFALICACTGSASMSKTTYLALVGKTHADRPPIKNYLIKLGLLTALSMTGCLINLLLSMTIKNNILSV